MNHHKQHQLFRTQQPDAILIVDDQEIIRRSLSTILENVGYQVTAVATVKEAVQCLHQMQYSLVLTDLRLNGESGLDIIEHVKQYYPKTLVILLTAYASVESAIAALRRGAYDYLVKPCNVDDLKHTVKRCLEIRRQGIENEQLRDELERAYFLTVRALAAAIDAKDRYTRGHSDRVMKYSTQIAEALEQNVAMTERLIRHFQYAAMIHDIGKIGIPDHILKKEGKYTPEEYSVMKQHPLLGYDMLRDVPYLQEVSLYLKHHHEWYNGKGYPDGLQGDDIPLGAQIIAVADAYDAMTSDRPYRRSYTHHEAIQEITNCSGSQFAPKVVEAFLSRYKYGIPEEAKVFI
ncbi:MAG: response regulator [bacterium]|nr:response regulator [bacterium]